MTQVLSNDMTMVIDRIDSFLRQNIASCQDDIGLASGLAGVALFYNALSKRNPSPEIVSILDNIIDMIHVQIGLLQKIDFGLYNGLTGAALALEYIAISRNGKSSDTAEINDEFDDAITIMFHSQQWLGHYDLISGLTGLGVYALARSKKSSRDQLFYLIFVNLLRQSTKASSGLYWRTQPQFAGLENGKYRHPNGNANLGLAHGNPGVIALFAWALKLGIRLPRLPEALHDATNWLIAQGTKGNVTYFSYIAEQKEVSARAAWCYGDPTAALAVIRSGHALGDANIINQGVEIGLHSARRDMDTSGVVDHGLCHGSSGLGFVYHALYRETKEGEFAAAAQRWFSRTIEAACDDSLEGLAAFDRGVRRKKVGALEGMAGIGLALLDSVESESNEWSNWLLV